MSGKANREKASQLRDYQFRLIHLLAVPLFLVLFFMVSGIGGFSLGSVMLLYAIAVMLAFSRRWKLLGVVLLFGLTALAFIWPALTATRKGDGAAMSCRRNLKKIGIALELYRDDYGSLPPAYVADDERRPMHSWRVLILPYLGRKDLHQKYRFDEPWDGPNNRKLANVVVDVYNCPADPYCPSPITNYVAVVGDRTAWPGAVSRGSFLPDGSSNTILLVETVNSDIHWMEPRDMEFGKMPFTINGSEKNAVSGNHPERSRFPLQEPNCVNVLMGDASVRSLSNDVGSETLRSLLLVDDGAPASDDYW